MPDDEVAALQARSQVPTGIAGSRVSADGVSTPPRLWRGWRLEFPSPGGFGSPCRKRWYYWLTNTRVATPSMVNRCLRRVGY
jgi:hypothetical protein